VVGHSFSNYGPLIAGATTLLYEGKPVGTPDAAQFWRLIERHRVKTLFTAPTGLRGIKRVDPQGELVKKFDISSLETLFVAGERADTDTLKWAEQSTGVSDKIVTFLQNLSHTLTLHSLYYSVYFSR